MPLSIFIQAMMALGKLITQGTGESVLRTRGNGHCLFLPKLSFSYFLLVYSMFFLMHSHTQNTHITIRNTGLG